MRLTLTDSEKEALKAGLDLAISLMEDDIERARFMIPDRSTQYAQRAAILAVVREKLGPAEEFDADAWLAKFERLA